MSVDWEPRAEALAVTVTHPVSRWRHAVATVPRHVFVPRWWESTGGGAWALRDGRADLDGWLEAAYADRTLVTRVGPLHADRAAHRDQPSGRPTSSSTLPGLVVGMFRHAMLADTSDALCVTGSGYGTALLARRLGEKRVTSVDVDPQLVEKADARLAEIGLHPQLAICDITGPLPGEFDRIVSTVSVPSIPASWLAALRPGGRLVTTIAGTGLIITADRTRDGGAVGRVEWDRAAFMATRHGDDYPPQGDVFDAIRDREGEQVTASPLPVVNVREAWELWSTFTLHAPGVEHWFASDDEGRRTAWMAHPDGSWARATALGYDPATVHQDGPRRLWDELDRIRRWWLADGYLNTYGARVTVTPDGETTLSRGGWTATL